MKLLRIDLEDPRDTEYCDPEEQGSFMWGRDVERYVYMIICDDLSAKILDFPSGNIVEMQNVITKAMSSSRVQNGD